MPAPNAMYIRVQAWGGGGGGGEDQPGHGACNRHIIQFVSHIRAIYTMKNVLSKMKTALTNSSRLISVLDSCLCECCS